MAAVSQRSAARCNSASRAHSRHFGGASCSTSLIVAGVTPEGGEGYYCLSLRRALLANFAKGEKKMRCSETAGIERGGNEKVYQHQV